MNIFRNKESCPDKISLMAGFQGPGPFLFKGAVSLVCLLFLGSHSLAEDSKPWKKIARDGEYEYLIHREHIKQKGAEVSFWMKKRSIGSGPGYRSVNYRLFCDTFEYREEGSRVAVGSKEYKKSPASSEKRPLDERADMLKSFEMFCGEKVTHHYPGGSLRGEGWVYADSTEGRDRKIKVGPWKYWYPGGMKSEELFFRRGRKHGAWITWDREGRKLKEEGYLNGVPHGPWISWYPNGRKSAESNYLLGKLEGKATTWSPGGKVTDEKWYREGAVTAPPGAGN